MDTFFNLYEKIIDSITELFDDAAFIVVAFSNKAIGWIQSFFKIVYQNYEGIAKSIYAPFRWTTIPLNYIIIRTWLWYVLRDQDNEPLDNTGIHLIRSNPGGGKSMLAYQKANELADHTGFTSYQTSRIEKPRLSEDEKFWVVRHPVIDIKSYYRKGKKIKRFNTLKYKALFVDEFHYMNNPRLNRSNDYNEFFLPFLNDLILMRHEGFDNNIYLFSQVPMNDIQLMSILANYHEVELKKGIDYWRWIRTGKFEIIPLYWRISTYTIDRSDPSKKFLYRKWKKHVDVDELEYFDTHAMKNEFSDLPLDYN